MSKRLVWLITGTSSGVGQELAVAALDRGDQVIATARARSFDMLASLKKKGASVVELDVTAPLEKLESIAADAVKIYGRVDVLVNNAGAGTTPGVLEDLTPDDTLHQFNTNLFGPLNVTRAFLPYMRERESGTIAWIGSGAAYSLIPNHALYCATKAAMIRISEALNVELQPFKIRSICFDLGWYRTDALRPDRYQPLVQRISAYKQMAEEFDAVLRNSYMTQRGDPAKAARLLVQILRGEGVAEGREIPSRLPIGGDAYDLIKEDAVNSLERIEEWKEVISTTDADEEKASNL
ncbi:short chain dehydrogenase [Heliocybe sulcata]|uniref:Short chain dehydrogenase n=1 Tax=Heliocybe sulcata TaxID=5364 RepID=A0A5C3MY02_9AGAM|nr:short chain dehydrogenase [Heliocybe sulcata]